MLKATTEYSPCQWITIASSEYSTTSSRPYIVIEYNAAVPVTSVSLPACSDKNVNWSGYITATVYPTNATNKTVYWQSSDNNVATVDYYTGLICTKLAGQTVITVTTADGGKKAYCTLVVKQVLTGSDTYITDQNIKDTIINSKTISDGIQNLYLSENITYSQKVDIQKSCDYAADIARADFIVVNDQSNFAYQHFKGRNYQNGDVTPFNRDLQLGSTYVRGDANTLDVLVVQRGMQAVGWFDPGEKYKYGTFDQETYDAAYNAPKMVLTGSKFDASSYRVVFQASTASFRTPQWLLQEYSRQHRKVQQELSGRTLGNIEVGIRNGGPSGNHYGYADVLRDYGNGSHIWEVKHEHPNNLQVGNSQLTRYTDAAVAYSQNFSKPLIRGYDFTTFYIEYSQKTYLEVYSTSVAGLVFYNEVPTSKAPPGYVPVAVPFPEAKKDYEFQLKPIPIAGTAVVATFSIVVVMGCAFLAVTTGTTGPLEESIRSLKPAFGF